MRIPLPKKLITTIKPFAGPLLLLGASLLTMIGAYSAYTATTSNSGNTISSQQLSMSDDDGNVAMFNMSGLLPGDADVVKCINVTNTNTTTLSKVSLNATVNQVGVKGDISPFTTLKIEVGSGAAGGTSHSCTGFVASTGGSDLYPASGTKYLNDIADSNSDNPSLTAAAFDNSGGWTAGASKSYRITLGFPSSSASDAASDDGTTSGYGASAAFTWTGSM